MSRVTRLYPVLMGKKKTYSSKVLATAPANLIGYWKLNETSGTTVVDYSAQANNGTYTGVDLANAAGPDGVKVPYFDGANDFADLKSVPFIADFDYTKTTFAIWAKIETIANWSDATRRLMYLTSGTGNVVNIRILSGTLAFGLNLSGTVFSAPLTGYSTAAWFHVAGTLDTTAQEIKIYLNGAQVGATVSTAGKTLQAAITNFYIGAEPGPLTIWKGWLAHAAVWNTALTAAQILNLATV